MIAEAKVTISYCVVHFIYTVTLIAEFDSSALPISKPAPESVLAVVLLIYLP
jgi:hypothetical protein